MSDLYEHDFFGWTNLQAQLLRDGRIADADLDHIAEEIEDLGKSRRQELRNRLAVLLLHLLKWQFQPDKRSLSWRSTIVEQRVRIADHLQSNPSLKPILSDSIATGYRYALLRIDRETGLSADHFPPAWPHAEADVLDEGFFPDAALAA